MYDFSAPLERMINLEVSKLDWVNDSGVDVLTSLPASLPTMRLRADCGEVSRNVWIVLWIVWHSGKLAVHSHLRVIQQHRKCGSIQSLGDASAR